MCQHFLLSAKARTLKLKDIYAMGDDRAYETFCQLRWEATDGKPACPECGVLDPYRIATRPRQFTCSGCRHRFSVTSGTLFSARKMSFTDLLAAICIFANAVKGVSALQLSRDIGCNPKSAFVLAHKIREAMASEMAGKKLSGEVEVDGAYFLGSVRPANLKQNRIDRRLVQNQSGKRRVVVAFRQREGRTLAFVTTSEAHGVLIVKRAVEKDTYLVADEAAHWDALHASYLTDRINHSEAYSLNGVSTNQVESYFARLRRMVDGQHHQVSPQHLHQYAHEAAWKEDHRRLDNGALAHRALGLALNQKRSKFWSGYWHRSVGQ
jgi:transposase-like protein